MSTVLLGVAIGLAVGALLALAGGRRRRGAAPGASPRAPAAPRASSTPSEPRAVPGRAGDGAAPGTLGLQASEPLRLLAHEMRTPLAAIIGYHELLADGLLGPLEGRPAEAVHRIGGAAEQLRHLLDGLHELVVPPDADPALEPEDVPLAATALTAVEGLRAMAEGRSATLEADVPQELPTLRTDRQRLAALLDLAFGAAVRASPGANLRFQLHADGGRLTAEMRGCALEPGRDDVALGEHATGTLSTGAALRLAMAGRMARILGGTVTLRAGEAGAILRLELPPLPN